MLQATIMTDPGTADRTYVGPMTPDMVEEIIKLVRHGTSSPTAPLGIQKAGQEASPVVKKGECGRGALTDI